VAGTEQRVAGFEDKAVIDLIAGDIAQTFREEYRTAGIRRCRE